MNTNEQIQAVADEWYQLAQERLDGLKAAADKLPPEMRMQVLGSPNTDIVWQEKFDAWRAVAVEVLPANHPFLAGS